MAATASGVYALGLAMSTVAFPLSALHAGHSGTDVGLLVGLSAAAQMTSRLFLARVMRVLADRTLVIKDVERAPHPGREPQRLEPLLELLLGNHPHPADQKAGVAHQRRVETSRPRDSVRHLSGKM